MGIILRWKNCDYMLEIDILRNDSQKYLGAKRGDFEDLGVEKTLRAPDALLAKTMSV